MFLHYAQVFWQLIRTPFLHVDLVWGIVPLYFGWILNELTSNKASARTALTTGFSFLWSAAHWLYQLFGARPEAAPKITLDVLLAVNVAVTLGVAAVGVLALVCGLRKRFPPGCSFLGHARFSNYFMIAIFPIQAQYLAWSWARVIAIALFALPLWVVCHFALAPLRK